MAQADSNYSTTAPVDPTRRRFLSNAASIAAGGTVLAMATAHPAPAIASQRVPDPILAAIEAHRAAMATLISGLAVQTALEKELPRNRRRGDETDPRWIACERDINWAWSAVDDAELALLNIRPTTRAGIVALLRYVVEHDTDGEGWQSELVSDDGTKTRNFYHFLVENVAEAMTEIDL
jgi:hypothetical protein